MKHDPRPSERRAEYPGAHFSWTHNELGHRICNCVAETIKYEEDEEGELSNVENWTTLIDCDNCLGYGIMPIPFQDLGMK